MPTSIPPRHRMIEQILSDHIKRVASCGLVVVTTVGLTLLTRSIAIVYHYRPLQS